MIKALLSVLFFLSPAISLACEVPKAGPEFDDLIVVEKTGKNIFKATIRKQAGDLNFGADITVGYYFKGSKRRVGVHWKEIYEKKEDDSNYIVFFNLKNIEGYVPFVQVFWYPKMGGMCGAYGKSKDLLLE